MLSILIPIIPKHRAMFNELVQHLQEQSFDKDVEIIYNDNDDSIGQKRQHLLEASSKNYVVFIDADDLVSDNYISLILKAIESNPDCVAINGTMTTNGRDKKKWFISKDYHTWHEANGLYYRHTNHISPVKREIALSVGFPDKNYGEDYDYSMGLRGKLHSEVVIEEPIYEYRYISNKNKQ